MCALLYFSWLNRKPFCAVSDLERRNRNWNWSGRKAHVLDCVVFRCCWRSLHSLIALISKKLITVLLRRHGFVVAPCGSLSGIWNALFSHTVLYFELFLYEFVVDPFHRLLIRLKLHIFFNIMIILITAMCFMGRHQFRHVGQILNKFGRLRLPTQRV